MDPTTLALGAVYGLMALYAALIWRACHPLGPAPAGPMTPRSDDPLWVSLVRETFPALSAPHATLLLWERTDYPAFTARDPLATCRAQLRVLRRPTKETPR